MARAISGGISCPRPVSGSIRRKKIGRKGGSISYPAMSRTSSRCRGRPSGPKSLSAPPVWRSVCNANDSAVPAALVDDLHEIEATGRGDRPAGRPIAFFQGPLQIGGLPFAFTHQLQTAGDRANLMMKE